MASIKLVVIDNPGANHLKVLDTLPASINVVVSIQARRVAGICARSRRHP